MGEVGTMQFRIYGEQIKNDERRKKRSVMKKEKNIYMYEKRRKYEFIKIK
jgi:hypothetical protein